MSKTDQSYATDTASEAQQKRQALSAIKARAGRDGQFRAALLADPFAALDVPRSGVAVGAEFPVRFVEAGSGEAAASDRRPTVVLPPLATTDELADAELEAVAGGGIIELYVLYKMITS